MLTAISVDLIDKMGSDLSIVNAARVSFNKTSLFEWDDETNSPVLSERDAKLIRYLATHGHWSPFGHAQAQFRINAPIFVARQLVKHQVGGCWNETSRRYVDSPPEFYVPDSWRGRAENKKQGSGDDLDELSQLVAAETLAAVIRNSLEAYNQLLAEGVCAEQARMVLPLNTMTEWIWTGSLYFFARVCKQRLDDHSQEETRQVAKKIADELKFIFPVSWETLMNSEAPAPASDT